MLKYELMLSTRMTNCFVSKKVFHGVPRTPITELAVNYKRYIICSWKGTKSINGTSHHITAHSELLPFAPLAAHDFSIQKYYHTR